MPLTILVVGAGIAGLSSAIALGRQGHTVHLFEKSNFSTEVGAAFHFAPHVTRILKNWNLDIDALRPSLCEIWRSVKLNGDLISTKFELRKKQKLLGVTDDEIMIHRIDAHSWLRKYALELPSVKLHLSSGIESVDSCAASIILEDGSTHHGDVVVGADGVHSKTVQFLTDSDCSPFTFGINMYRFMVPTEKAQALSAAKRFLDRMGYQTTHNTIIFENEWQTGSLVMYPCRAGSLMNMATFQPASVEKVGLEQAYTNLGTVEEVLDLFEMWPEEVKELTSLAEDVKHWACVTGKPRETFVNNRLVLIGDAAHPTLPTHGAGAGIAIEDAAVLGILLDSTATRENVEERLKLFNDLRFERATIVKCASNMQGANLKERALLNEKLLKEYVPCGEIPSDMEAYLWPFDAVADAKQAMQKLSATNG